MSKTQCEKILFHMKQYGAINPLQALDLYGCFRLGARIYDLKQDGHDIGSRLVYLDNGKHYSEYWLKSVVRDGSSSHKQLRQECTK